MRSMDDCVDSMNRPNGNNGANTGNVLRVSSHILYSLLLRKEDNCETRQYAHNKQSQGKMPIYMQGVFFMSEYVYILLFHAV
jgi:hypothetical protein